LSKLLLKEQFMKDDNDNKLPYLLTLDEGSSLLRLKTSTLRAWILRRRINFVKLGGRIANDLCILSAFRCSLCCAAQGPVKAVECNDSRILEKDDQVPRCEVNPFFP
jgi:hypothetical protein